VFYSHAGFLSFLKNKPGPLYPFGISATRLSQRDPVGFPSHFRKWFSIIVYHSLCTSFIAGNRTYLCDWNHI